MTNSKTPSLHMQFRMTRDRFDVDVDLTLDLSEPAAIFGASGSGKTSVLRAIAGLERADPGQISLNDEVWQSERVFLPAHQRSVGYVFQDARLFPHLSVSGNLALASGARSGRRAISEKEVVDNLDIGDLLERDTVSLSGGETQRVAIARTLLSQPKLLLMDEPVSSLDAASRHETIEYISRLTETFGLPMLYVTHDSGEVARLAGTTVWLENGKVSAAGPTPEVFARMQRNAAGAETVSILAAEVSSVSGRLCELVLGEQRLRLPMHGQRLGERVQLRVFAADVVIAAQRIEDTSIRNILRGSIREIHSLAAGTVELHIDVDGQLLRAQVTAEALEELGLSAGNEVFAMIKSVALASEKDSRN
jgi:molybdate transport system ATP-binding protein